MQKLVLASGSSIRAALLSQAGFEFEIDVADIDESELKRQFQHESPQELALRLASAKAEHVSSRHPGCLVIGSDQLTECSHTLLAKPLTELEAVETLSYLAGRWHNQHTATCIYKDGECVWQTSAMAKLLMKPLDFPEIMDYVSQDNPIGCVGAYRFESHGAKLFERVDGEADVIQGFNLGSLVEYLSCMAL